MSAMKLPEAMQRIRQTNEISPVAVFARCGAARVDVVFANTAKTRYEINSADPAFIGEFHGGMDLSEVEQLIIGCMARAEIAKRRETIGLL